MGANRAIARHVVRFLEKPHVHPSHLFLGDAGRPGMRASGMTIVEGDVSNADSSAAGDEGARHRLCRSGEVAELAGKIIDAMNETGVKQLIFVTSLGIYDEVPPSANGTVRMVRTCHHSGWPPTSRFPAWTTPSCVPLGSPITTK
ncbi:MAG: NAD(P)H-binding protein [Nitrospirales bacterium]|nr:NAD(P)H-binding protein [Nitrospirales bacterium]